MYKKNKNRNMRYLILLTLFTTLNLFSQNTNKGKCDIEVVKVTTQRLFGRNVGYHLTLLNNSTKTVDSVDWEVIFTDKFGDVKEIKEERWSSGAIITLDTSKNVISGKEINTTMTNFVKDATNVYIVVKRVHFTDGTTCN